jgi:NAD(P)-dependent dehydrogenase (short-subunit alcohol dehydrogenase family)
VATDLSQPEGVGRLVRDAHAHFGRLDALVNAAGMGELHEISVTTPQLLRRTFETNTFSVALAIAAAWPVFTAQKRGCVVNVSSMATADPLPGFFVYAASKAAIDIMAKSCAIEGAGLGIRAFSVAPGAVETPLLRSLFDAQALPSSQCLEPEFIARVITDCVQGERDEDNGQVIYLPSPG